MAEVLEKAYELISDWVKVPKYLDSFPPIVINITDGQPNDMQQREMYDGSQTKAAAEKLKSIKTTDGNLLLFNLHVSNERTHQIVLPSNISELNDKYAKFLFELSSELPDQLIKRAQKVGLSSQPQARAFVFNADAETLIKLLTFGTIGIALR